MAKLIEFNKAKGNKGNQTDAVYGNFINVQITGDIAEKLDNVGKIGVFEILFVPFANSVLASPRCSIVGCEYMHLMNEILINEPAVQRLTNELKKQEFMEEYASGILEQFHDDIKVIFEDLLTYHIITSTPNDDICEARSKRVTDNISDYKF